jgi:PAS domain S-box-containing protein
VAAIAVLAARSAATLAIIAALAQLARTLLLGKIVGAIVAGVVAMAAGAVGVVGTGVADEVQSQQSQRLLQVAQSQKDSFEALKTRASLYAQVVAQCPTQRTQCEQFLRLFSDHEYFAVLVFRSGGVTRVAANPSNIDNATLVQLAGEPLVRSQLVKGAGARPQGGSGPLLLSGGRPTVAVVAAVPGGATDARVAPKFAAVYGIRLDDDYLRALAGPTGYDLTLVADGQVLASSLTGQPRTALLAEARSAHVGNADPSVSRVVPAQSTAPTAAFVGVTPVGTDDVRIATLAVSQPANEALRAQRNVLQRLFLTTLVALVVVALLAVALAQRIADPVRRLTVAAGRVRRGDLEATATLPSRDEVGSLSRAFDAMTESLRRLTADLRATAAQEAALRARLETVVESMSDGLVVTDERSFVTAANPTALALLGRTVDDVLGRALSDVMVVEDAEGRPVLDGDGAGEVTDAELVRGAGERLPVRFGVAPLGGGQGRVVVIADRRREYEIERMKTEFLANVSHELRTPLTPIRGYAEMLARRPDLSREQVELFLDEILGSTARMSRAVELLVDVAALEGGQIAPERTQVQVRGLVDDRLAAWRERYPDRAGDFKRKVGTRLPAVDIDRRWVTRALDELADNAVKYTSAGTPVTLAAAVTDDAAQVRVVVRDAGPGFDPQRTSELVDDFSQADASETRRVGGLGLGLGFVSRVASRFGLPFEVSTEPGRGSEFALMLPAAAGPPEPRKGNGRARTTTGARPGR